MSFGLCNAPATFQHLMNLVVSGLEGFVVYLYVVIYSNTWEEHLHHVKKLFDPLADARLTINLAKCEFAKAIVTYLVMVLEQGNVRPVQAKVTAIGQYPVLATKKELQCFLGLVGYYRSFCRSRQSTSVHLVNKPSTMLNLSSVPLLFSQLYAWTVFSNSM